MPTNLFKKLLKWVIIVYFEWFKKKKIGIFECFCMIVLTPLFFSSSSCKENIVPILFTCAYFHFSNSFTELMNCLLFFFFVWIQVRPGVLFRELGSAITRRTERDGFSVVKSYCGHGVNQLFHCAPNVPHYSSAYKIRFLVSWIMILYES